MNDRHAEHWERLKKCVLDGPGNLDSQVRKAIAAETTGSEIPPVLLPYLDKVNHHAYQVTDEDFETLGRAGLSEDQIFEATIAAALGAGLKRLQIGLALLGKG